MKLSNSDRRSLAQIAAAMATEDPEFVARMAWLGESWPRWPDPAGDPAAHPRRRAVAAWLMVGLLPVGIALLVVGSMLSVALVALGSCVLTGDLVWVSAYGIPALRARRARRRRAG